MLSWVLLKRNKRKSYKYKDHQRQTAMALKVSQTKFYWEKFEENIWSYDISLKKTQFLSTSRNARHTHYKMSSFLWILFSTAAKNEVWSTNHMHLFTSKSLSNYDKPQIKGVQEGEGEGRGMDKNLLQGKVSI